MATKTTVKIEGLRELGNALKELDSRVQKRIARSATAAGARVIAKEAKARVPVDEGIIKKNIRTANLKPNQPGMQESIVGVRVRGKTKDSAFAWRFVEFGYIQTRVRVKGSNGEWITLKRKLDAPIARPAQPFLRPAFEAKKQEAAERMKEQLQKRIDAEAAKIGQTIGKAR